VLLKGFLCGLHAGNYDITHVFIDEFYKILNDRSDEAVLQFLDWLNTFGEKEKVNFTIIATADPAAVCEGIKKYF
jgi:archaellum biogenesis ATPase FlaH